MAYNSLYMYFYITIHYTQLCVNNVEVTVRICTCTDVFTVITTKNQSGERYSSYSTSGQGFMVAVNKPRNWATPSDLVCLLQKIPCILQFTELIVVLT